jgi:hypothetical protein
MRDRLVRWFGDPSPWSDPTIAKALAAQTLSLSLTDRLRFFDKWQRQILVTGGSERTLGAESGMSNGCNCSRISRSWVRDAGRARSCLPCRPQKTRRSARNSAIQRLLSV